jgi:hexokinase
MASSFGAATVVDALLRAGKPCRVLALINDSVGVLTAARYFDQSTGLGVILGTGTNACIVEKVSGECSRKQLLPRWVVVVGRPCLLPRNCLFWLW